MPPDGNFDNIISRSDAQALIPEDAANDIIQHVAEQSAALALFRRVPMSRKQRRIPVVSALPVAYFVNGDTGVKQTSEVNWDNKFLDAEEIAVIIPIPEAVLDDSAFPIWSSVRPMVAEAVGRTLDAAIFLGENKPATWPEAIVPAAEAAGKEFQRGTNGPDTGGIAGDFSDLMGLVEGSGYTVTGIMASTVYRGLLRQARAADGQRLSDISATDIFGVVPQYPLRGLWPDAGVEAIAGDFQFGLLGVRQDLTYKILDQAIISDNEGKIIYNLPQQDMLALRVVARFAFQVGAPMTHDQPDPDARYPFAVMTAPGGGTRSAGTRAASGSAGKA